MPDVTVFMTFLVSDAALDGGVGAEHVAGGLAQRPAVYRAEVHRAPGREQPCQLAGLPNHQIANPDPEKIHRPQPRLILRGHTLKQYVRKIADQIRNPQAPRARQHHEFGFHRSAVDHKAQVDDQRGQDGHYNGRVACEQRQRRELCRAREREQAECIGL